MKSYLAYTAITLRLTLRDRAALFFTYIFPLLFFFIFAQSSRAEQGGVITQVVTMVFILAVLGNGLFGAGVRAVQEREMNILRRFKVTPISPAPILFASMVTGWLVFIPAALLTLVLAHSLYGMPVPVRLASLLGLVSLGVIAFRALGLIVASVVNSTQENAILMQLLYLPMLFLSGAIFPTSVLPDWAQILVQLLPASYLSTGFQGIMMRQESLAANGPAVIALLLTTAIGTFLSVKLFRWEKEEKLPASAKLWVLVVLLPFILLGSYEAYTKDNVNKAKLLHRAVRRSRTLLIRDARIFIGDGKVIESGSVLIRNGRVEQLFDGQAAHPKLLKAEVIEGAGKTLLPGLVDAHVRLMAPGGVYDAPSKYEPGNAMLRALAGYLYSGVTTVGSAGDPLEMTQRIRSRLASGDRLGAELLFRGPIFTAEGGYGGEYFKAAPRFQRFLMEKQVLRMPATADDARRQVDELQTAGVDGIKAILDSGTADMLFRRMDLDVLRAVAGQAHLRNLPLVVHTGDSRDVADAVTAGADGIEDGSFRDVIPERLFVEMSRRGVAYVPALSVREARSQLAAGKTELLERSLVLQVGPAGLVNGTGKALKSSAFERLRETLKHSSLDLETGRENLRRAHKAGVMLVTGSGAGNLLVFHGPALHRELQLWVQDGIPPLAALQAATYNAARLLRVHNRIGLIRAGREADLLLVDGNPLQDISATERISLVIFKGERIYRAGLFEQR